MPDIESMQTGPKEHARAMHRQMVLAGVLVVAVRGRAIVGAGRASRRVVSARGSQGSDSDAGCCDRQLRSVGLVGSRPKGRSQMRVQGAVCGLGSAQGAVGPGYHGPRPCCRDCHQSPQRCGGIARFAQHEVHRSGAVTAAKGLVVCSARPVCLQYFRRRIRAIQHLRPRDDASNRCRLALHAGGFPVIDR